LQQFNDAVKFKASLETQNRYLSQIRDFLPESTQEIKAAFQFMIQQGLIMNFSLLIARLG
jgi:hypothetical protein